MLQCKTKWKKEQLKNILEDSYAGGTPNRSREDFYGGTLPWVTSGEVNQSKIIETNEYITDLGYKNSSAKMIPKDTVLLAMYGATAGQVSMLKIPATSNQAVLAIIPCKELDKNYLYHNLRYFKERILFSAQGSGQTNLSKELVEKYKITFPTNTEEQSKIADILSTCDEVIEKTGETIEKYKQIKAGMMQDLFTRGLDANCKLRPTYAQSPDLYKYSKELDRYIPKEWIVKPFCELYEIPSKNGLTKPSKVRGEGYKMINMGELFANKKIGNIQMELVPLSEIEKRNFEINIYDLLFARQSLVAEGAGKCSIVTNIGSYTTFESHIIRIRLDKTLYHPMYYLYLFDSNLSPTKKLIQVGAQAGIRGSELAMVNVTCPKYEEQEIIKDCLEKIDNKIDIEYKLFQKYKQIKQGLMKRLLTPPADAEIVEE